MIRAISVCTNAGDDRLAGGHSWAVGCVNIQTSRNGTSKRRQYAAIRQIKEIHEGAARIGIKEGRSVCAVEGSARGHERAGGTQRAVIFIKIKRAMCPSIKDCGSSHA